MRTDIEIRNDIEEELKREPSLHDAGITVTVKNGCVTLSGTTTSYRGKLAANQAAARIKGVKVISDKIAACLPVYNCLTDKIVTIEIMNALRWHSVVSSERITIKVKSGIVTIMGEVEELNQLEAALNAIRHLRGIQDIINCVTLKLHPGTTPVRMAGPVLKE